MRSLYEVLQVMSLRVVKEVMKALLKVMEVLTVLRVLSPLQPQTQLHRAHSSPVGFRVWECRGTSLIRNSGRLGPYSTTMLKALCQS